MSRLHELCVRLEAASPGDIRSGGAGWRIRAGFTDTPFGDALIAVGPRGVCKLSFVRGEPEREREWSVAKELWPNATWSRADKHAEAMAASIFRNDPGRSSKEPLKLYVRGTRFQNRVWRALTEIPAGETRSYADIARAIGAPRSTRAVGTAVGSNPVGFLIPCHRVIYASGLVGSYRWGAERKKAMLVWEGVRRAARNG